MTREEEKQAVARLMGFLLGRLAAAPNAHLYHHALYEKTALRRLASMAATVFAYVFLNDARR